jgi:hypothetical protein
VPFEVLPEVGPTKIRIVIEERRAVFSVDNFTKIDGDDLKALFIELNFEDYRKKRADRSMPKSSKGS